MAGRATRHGAVPLIMHHPELLETKIAAQASEIEQLVNDNRRLVASHISLREELAVAKQESQKLKVHMRSLKTESDIQIRVLREKIARSEARIKAGEGVEKDVEKAFKEAQGLVIARKEMAAKIQGAKQELEKARDETNSLPDFRVELDSLKREHQRLRETFEYEKSSNMEQVENLQMMEQEFILMAKEVEKLRIEVLNAGKRANATIPYSDGYVNNPNAPNPPQVQGNVAYNGGYAPVNHKTGERSNVHGSSGSAAPSGTSFLATGDAEILATGDSKILASVAGADSTSGDDMDTHSDG